MNPYLNWSTAGTSSISLSHLKASRGEQRFLCEMVPNCLSLLDGRLLNKWNFKWPLRALFCCLYKKKKHSYTTVPLLNWNNVHFSSPKMQPYQNRLFVTWCCISIIEHLWTHTIVIKRWISKARSWAYVDLLSACVRACPYSRHV